MYSNRFSTSHWGGVDEVFPDGHKETVCRDFGLDPLPADPECAEETHRKILAWLRLHRPWVFDVPVEVMMMAREQGPVPPVPPRPPPPPPTPPSDDY